MTLAPDLQVLLVLLGGRTAVQSRNGLVIKVLERLQVPLLLSRVELLLRSQLALVGLRRVDVSARLQLLHF